MSKSATALVGVGVFCLSLAGLTAAVAQPRLLKAPLELTSNTQWSSPGARVDETTGKLVQGTITIDRRTGTASHKVGNKYVAYGDSKTAVYTNYTDTSFTPASGGSAVNLNILVDTVAFDRKTGKITNSYSAGSNELINSTGYFIKLPFDAKGKSYGYFETNTKRTATMTYVGDKTIRGLKVRDYVFSVPGTDMGVLPVLGAVPGAWVGKPSVASIPAHQWIAVPEQHVFVEPVTGSPVGGTLTEEVWAQTADGARVDLARIDHLTQTAASEAKLVADVKNKKSQTLMIKRAPWVLGGLGIVLLAVVPLLSRRRGPQTIVMPDVSGHLPQPRTEAPLRRRSRAKL